MNKALNEVAQLQMTKALFVPGLFEVKRTLNQQAYPGIEMEGRPTGVVCLFKGITFLIPYSMIECVVFK